MKKFTVGYLILFLMASGASAKETSDSCLEVACKMGHCKLSTEVVAKACAGAKDSCVAFACKENSFCKYELKFIAIAESCTPTVPNKK